MPYIKKDERPQYENVLCSLPDIKTKGDLEFCIFYLMQRFRKTRAEKYTELHDATYAATHCADEFRRRFLDDRENTAREVNGDVIV